NAFPSLTVNRYKMPWPWATGLAVESQNGSYGASVWNDGVNENRSVPAPVSVSIYEQQFDPDSRQLRVTVRARFYAPIEDNFRFNVYLVENNVTGTGSGYDQRNFLDDEPGTPFFGQGDPIVGYNHKHVLRAMLGGAWGTAGSIPQSVVPDTFYQRTYNYTVPATWKVQDVKVVAMVKRFNSDPLKRPILNAVDNPLTNNITPTGGDITITTTTTGSGAYCPGESFNLNIAIEGQPGPNNSYQVQLSSPSGSFAAPTVVATASSPGLVNVALPSTLTPGSNYLIRVASSNPPSYSQPFNIQILGPLTVNFNASTTTFNQGQGPYRVNFTNLSPLTQGVTFEWDFGDGQSAQGTNASHDYADTLDYTVVLRAYIDGKPCTESFDTLNIRIRDTYRPSSTLERILQSYAVYPNPARNKFEIRRTETVNVPVRVVLTDMRGAVVYQAVMNEGVEISEVPVEGLSEGLFLLRLSTDSASVSRKIYVIK
ncbi:MAG: Omp28-related outer membrane protein, partial [Bacteroidia bacterium]|nr:Omp28-related outer membrane protein [Bacteroidia bacterium]